MVEAMIPDRIRPARRAGKKPKVLSRCAISTMIVSETLAFSSSPTVPVRLMPRPTIPIRIAAPMAITTQILAILLERVSFFSSSIAMKRSRICGIPK